MSVKKCVGSMLFQKTGFAEGLPYVSINAIRDALRSVSSYADGLYVTWDCQLYIRSVYDPTTPPQITATFISVGSTTKSRSVMLPPIECPHTPILFGLASGYFFIELSAFKSSTVYAGE